MEFYKTQGSIIALKEKSSIDINELFGLIICVVSDCYKSLGVKDVSGMRAGDPKQMVLGLNSIASMLLKASDENAETIEELKTAIRGKIDETKALLQDANKQFSEISDSIGEQQAQEIALRDKLTGLENKKLEYERYAEECGNLQAIIDELSDENIEKIRKNMEKMEENVQERRKLRDELDLKIQEQSLLLNEQEKATAEKSSKLKEIQKRVSEAKKEVEKIAYNPRDHVDDEQKDGFKYMRNCEFKSILDRSYKACFKLCHDRKHESYRDHEKYAEGDQ